MSNIWLCVNTTDVLFPQIATDARECVIKPLRLVDATGTKLSSKEAEDEPWVDTIYFCTSCLWRHKQFRPALMVNCHGVLEPHQPNQHRVLVAVAEALMVLNLVKPQSSNHLLHRRLPR